jgi:hypothetical protein
LLLIGATIAVPAAVTKNLAASPSALARIIVEDLDALRDKLEELRRQHRELDAEILRLNSEQPSDQLQLQRLKRRKLMLKDEMTSLNGRLIPDIIA